MAKQKQKPKDEGPKGAPEWVVTFTDMISLLVTFFVLLMTFSSLEDYDLLKVESWLSGNTGIVQNRGLVSVDLPEEDVQAATDVRRGAMYPHDRPADRLEENLAEMGQRKRPGDLEMFFEDVEDGILIEFGEEGIFPLGSAAVPAPLIKSLGEMAKVLEVYPHLVVIEGYPDRAFTPSSRFGTAEELSFARANACAQIMLRASNLPVERVQIIGMGEEPPPGDDARRKPRHHRQGVLIRVLTLSKLRASFVENR